MLFKLLDIKTVLFNIIVFFNIIVLFGCLIGINANVSEFVGALPLNVVFCSRFLVISFIVYSWAFVSVRGADGNITCLCPYPIFILSNSPNALSVVNPVAIASAVVALLRRFVSGFEEFETQI